ncbi:MAG: PIN domain-containing protein [Flavobacteriales bacterium]
MNNGFVLDTNIILYSLAGDRALTKIFAEDEIFVSAMVRMETMIYHGPDETHLAGVAGFLEECRIIEITRPIQDLAVEMRIRFGLKLPDAVIAATSAFLDRPLLTADGSFNKAKAMIEVLHYQK